MATHADTRLSLPPWLIGAAALTGATLGYTLAVDPVVTSAAQVAYPAVWVAASLLALLTVRDRLSRLTAWAGAVGAGYTLLLLTTSGLVGTGGEGLAVTVHLATPGWGPAVAATGFGLRVLFVPYLVAGYAVLGLLAALATREAAATRATLPGVVGAFACVSCAAPLLAGLAGSLGAGSLAAALPDATYPLGTAAFLASLGGFLLVLRRY